MKRIAIIGGGISGLTAAYELELARKRGAPIDWHLYEASDRLGGIIETTRYATPEGEFILEGGPDGWVSEKPWARELAIELGLEAELIYSNDATRKTYILVHGKLQPIPDRMRMMVPEDLSALGGSPLFSESAKKAYADELARAEELKVSAPDHDESVADFVRRHFGDEVLNTLAAPLLSGVFGGDVYKLSVRAVMPQLVAMEREHGSLIAGLQVRVEHNKRAAQPIFTSLRDGMAALVDAIVARLPSERITKEIEPWPLEDGGWRVLAGKPDRTFLFITTYRTRSEKDISEGVDHIILATPLDVTRSFTGPTGIELKTYLPAKASSAILVAFAWREDVARSFTIPSGFGFLVPDESPSEEQLLACTFVDQKFPHRTPQGARVMRAFFGGQSAQNLESQPDEVIAICALQQLREILGPIPEPAFHVVRRWPRSLPQYEVGHLERIAQLEKLVAQVPGLHLLGNSYRGVGIPDLIRDARAAARAIVAGV
ncbi:MAG TPA: protoporphyrinogen oxidase [Acidobacteriaceae bacterium]|nr:protoporphyrinogen oxidase [Acidobacteriaceae bacterium]